MSDSPDDLRVPFESLPIPALHFRGAACVAVNAPYVAMMGYPAEEVVGRTLEQLVGLVSNAGSSGLLEKAVDSWGSGHRPAGELWCSVTDKQGRARPIRVRWTTPSADGEFFVYLLDEAGEANSKALAEALARAGGELVHCPDERVVLEQAADALYQQGLAVSVLLIVPGSTHLTYGPHRTHLAPAAMTRSRETLAAIYPRREILEQLNPRFSERRAAFFHDPGPTVDAVYPEPARSFFRRVLAGMHLVQAPLFVDGVAYGALVVHSPELTPSRAATVEMFAELVARGIESVRLKRRAELRLEELQRLQAELLQRERLVALGEAAAVMAHEVRNPIAAITNAIAMLRRLPGEAAPELLRVIGEEASRLERVISDLLDLGRPLTPRQQAVDLGELALRCVGILRDRSEGAPPSVTVQPTSTPVRAWVDPDLLQLALLNVLQNAVQASPPGAEVVVQVSADADRARVAVEDRGPGFSGELAARMFEPFFTTRASGTGIGLAVVRRVVEANSGVITLGRGEAGGGRFEMAFARAG